MSAEPTVPYSEHQAVIDDYAASEREVRRLRREVTKLLNEAAVPEDSPEAAEVKQLLELWWKEVMGSAKTVAHGLDSTRAPKVRAALRRRKRISKTEGFEMCRKAILGAKEDDWAMGRVAKSGGRKFNDIAEHILNTDGDIEKFAALFDKRHEKHEKFVEAEVRRLSRSRELPSWEDPVETLLAALTRDGWEWRVSGRDGWVAQCPAHQGTHFNLSVDWNTPGDRLLLKCWSRDCSAAEVMAALDLPVSALFRRSAA
jgi:hypothetical protein